MHLELPNVSVSSSQEEEHIDSSQRTLVEYPSMFPDDIHETSGVISTQVAMGTPIRGQQQQLLNTHPMPLQDDIFRHLQLGSPFSLPQSPLYPQQPIVPGSFYIPTSIAPLPLPPPPPGHEQQLGFPASVAFVSSAGHPQQPGFPAAAAVHGPPIQPLALPYGSFPPPSSASSPGYAAPLTPSSFEHTLFPPTTMAEMPIAGIGQPQQYQPQPNGPINSSPVVYRQPADIRSSRRARHGATICSVCAVSETPSWRRHKVTSAIVCNACGLYYNLHGRNREFVMNSRGQSVVKRQARGVSKRRKLEAAARRLQQQHQQQQQQQQHPTDVFPMPQQQQVSADVFQLPPQQHQLGPPATAQQEQPTNNETKNIYTEFVSYNSFSQA
ncbi:GATA type transcriptional activator of nitrogen-regulated proteins [Coemansia sp. RSA 1286]|nr:GATA type transcriptional activator of nitrogen-regulated proteins [Coemansia sp. RSA 1286]